MDVFESSSMGLAKLVVGDPRLRKKRVLADTVACHMSRPDIRA